MKQQFIEEKATLITNTYYVDLVCSKGYYDIENARTCAVRAVKIEYNSNRELLFNLRSCGVIESEQVYLSRVQCLINEEKALIEEINNQTC